MKWLLALLLTSLVLLLTQKALSQDLSLDELQKLSEANERALMDAQKNCATQKNYDSDLKGLKVTFKSDGMTSRMLPIGLQSQGRRSNLEFLGEGQLHQRSLYTDGGKTYYVDKNGASWIVDLANADPGEINEHHEASLRNKAASQKSLSCWFADTYTRTQGKQPNPLPEPGPVDTEVEK